MPIGVSGTRLVELLRKVSAEEIDAHWRIWDQVGSTTKSTQAYNSSISLELAAQVDEVAKKVSRVGIVAHPCILSEAL